jgi:hypothetical protein
LGLISTVSDKSGGKVNTLEPFYSKDFINMWNEFAWDNEFIIDRILCLRVHQNMYEESLLIIMKLNFIFFFKVHQKFRVFK